MPIVNYNNHPSFIRVASEGFDVLTATQAKHQDIRELHIGFLNMMPDAAFLATERQFFRLTAAATNIVQIYIHPIRCEGVTHDETIAAHIATFYHDFDAIKAQGLDALIVTGANPQFSDLTQENYWQHATEVFEWAENNVASVFFSCLATHAVLQAQYGIKRQPTTEKIWGVYPHRVQATSHPLVSNINTQFSMPHSRGNDISAEDFTRHSLPILVSSDSVGVALATSPDGFRQIFCQGHPEYDTASLLKEYQREIGRFVSGERNDYPRLPDHYGSEEIIALLHAFETQLLNDTVDLSVFPDSLVMRLLDNTWRDTAKAIFSNWLGLVYRVTHVDRQQQFMDGIDPKNPLSL